MASAQFQKSISIFQTGGAVGLRERAAQLSFFVLRQIRNLRPMSSVYVTLNRTCPLDIIIAHWATRNVMATRRLPKLRDG